MPNSIAPVKYHRIWEAAVSQPWAIEERKAAEILAFLQRKVFGYEDDDAPRVEIVAKAQPEDELQVYGGVGILPLTGTMVQKANLFTDFSGGTSTEAFGRKFDAMVEDDSIHSIVIRTDSPGGSAFGVKELAAKVYEARSVKKIVASVDSMMASAAYWTGAAASEIMMTPGGLVGSIGVYQVHQDYSGYEEKLGRKTSFISAGKHKVAGHSFAPLSEDSKAVLQKMVDDYYQMFVSDVAKYRGASSDAVKNGFGEGRVVTSLEAVKERMVDGIETFDQTVERLAEQAPQRVYAKRRASVSLAKRKLKLLTM